MLDETIVLVPGIYSPRLIMLLLAHRFRKQGYRTLTAANRFLTQSPEDNARRVLLQIQRLDTGTVHLFGHSLGGIVIMHLLKLNSQLPASQQIPEGRVVLMAAPVRGSELAHNLYTKAWMRPLMGKSVTEGLLGDAPLALYGREAGVISGSSRRGVFALFFNPAGINDGAVRQSETELDGACDAVCIPQSHALMLFSRVSVEKSAAFFRFGRFV